jgi:hypothetical protein
MFVNVRMNYKLNMVMEAFIMAMNKLEIIESLKGKCSTDYSGWLRKSLLHLEKYGEEPVMEYVGITYEGNNLELIKGAENVYGRNGISNEHAKVLIKNNKVYEVFNAKLFIAKCTVKEYLNYQRPMPYNLYIMG